MSTTASPAPALKPNDLFAGWGSAIRHLQGLLDCEPDAKEDDPDVRRDIISWCQQVKTAAESLERCTTILREANMPVTVDGSMVKAFEQAIQWGKRLQQEDAAVEPPSSVPPLPESASTTANVPPATTAPDGHDVPAEIDPVTPAPKTSIGAHEQTPRRSARQEGKKKPQAAAVLDDSSGESEHGAQSDRDDALEGHSEGSKEGWIAYDINNGAKIGTVRNGSTHYLKRCSSCVAKGREECEGPAGVACLSCKKSGSKCDYAFHGKKDLRPPTKSLKRKATAPPVTPAKGGEAENVQPAPDGADAKRFRSSVPVSAPKLTLVTPAPPPSSLPLPSTSVAVVVPALNSARVFAPRLAGAKLVAGKGAGSSVRPSPSASVPESSETAAPKSAGITQEPDVPQLVAELREQQKLVAALTASVTGLTAEVARLRSNLETECDRISRQRESTARLQAEHSQLTIEVESLRRELREAKRQ
ncbi:hypothetical protein BOTBODRAFT_48656 [Botryobasidium botryosum FD-172 SS1]|uniref:Zn(2)-C6 fungal-type domain-containing protein n=1 Tax=Botryobasidium botryosum (strain FD-172 SS1) TaxID=930990 RepID=A0A067M6X6_BOTB1|nr:hypothetical protein BOTBODRAFT_48656 [Botryobasidium botryosum FD-172 SS1]